MVHLNPLPSGLDLPPAHLGRPLGRRIAQRVCADAAVDPISLIPYEPPAPRAEANLIAATLGASAFGDEAPTVAEGALEVRGSTPPSCALANTIASVEAVDVLETDHSIAEALGVGSTSLPPGGAPRDDRHGGVVLRHAKDTSLKVAGAIERTPEAGRGGACPADCLEATTVQPALRPVAAAGFSATAEYAAWTGGLHGRELLLRLSETLGLDDCGDGARLWVLHTSVGAALQAIDVAGAPAFDVLEMLRVALAYLERVRAFRRGAWPAQVVGALEGAMTSCWRQALLQPLRTRPVGWSRLVDLVPAVPLEALTVLQPEMIELLTPAGLAGTPPVAVGSKACDCSPEAIAALRPSTCDAPHTCTDVRRRVSNYVTLHPMSGIIEPLEQLVAVLRPLLPPPCLWMRAVRRRLAVPERAAGARGMFQEAFRHGERPADRLPEEPIQRGRKRGHVCDMVLDATPPAARVSWDEIRDNQGPCDAPRCAGLKVRAAMPSVLNAFQKAAAPAPPPSASPSWLKPSGRGEHQLSATTRHADRHCALPMAPASQVWVIIEKPSQLRSASFA